MNLIKRRGTVGSKADDKVSSVKENEHIAILGVLRMIMNWLNRDPGILCVSLLSLGLVNMSFLALHH